MKAAILLFAASLLAVPALDAKHRRGGQGYRGDDNYYGRSGYGYDNSSRNGRGNAYGRDAGWHSDKWRAKAERDYWKAQAKRQRAYERSRRDRYDDYRDSGYRNQRDRYGYPAGQYGYGPGYYAPNFGSLGSLFGLFR